MAIRTTFSLDGKTQIVRTKGKRGRPEQDFQARLVRALKSLLFPETVMFAVPNGGFRTPTEAAILIGQGVLPGVPDLVFIHCARAFGLELKSKDGRLNGNQRDAHVRLRAAGMRIEVARSIDEALEHLREMGIPLRIKEEDWEYGARKRAAA